MACSCDCHAEYGNACGRCCGSAAPPSLQDWYPTVWQRDDEIDTVRIERTVSPFYDGERFAVRRSGLCLNRCREWEYEPIPSERDDAFYERARFRSLAEAVEYLEGE